jgi:hypothetical protein
VLLITLILSSIASVCNAATCSPHEIGADTSSANGAVVLEFGEAVGQTFMATDTLIQSITVWRDAAEDTALIEYYLFIVGTDSLGQPGGKILLQGTLAFNYYGDGTHDIPITFSFDPPFALPGPGEYEFAVQLAPCTNSSDLVVGLSNPYPDGIGWNHTRASCGQLRGATAVPTGDMIFSIVFCDQAVPTRTETWGGVKARYR